MRVLKAAIAALAVGACAVSAAAQTIRPAPITLVRPVMPAAEICADATRPGFLASFGERMDSVMGYGEAVGEYGARLSDWKGARLIELGAWTEADHGAFMLALLQDEGFMAFINRSMGEVGAMTQSASAYEDALEAGDDAAACANALVALTAADRVVSSAAGQWAYMHARYDSEAAARGLSLE